MPGCGLQIDLSENQRAGRSGNHALLLAIDPARGEAAIMPGYGLEPFLNQEALDHLLEVAAPAWNTGLWASGILGVLDGLDQWLETIALPHEAATPVTGES